MASAKKTCRVTPRGQARTLNNTPTTVETRSSYRCIRNAANKVTVSSKAASEFLKSAGIMTAKGNLSPKYR